MSQTREQVKQESWNFSSYMKQLISLSESEHFRIFLRDPKAQALLSDQSFRDALQKKDYGKLLEHPGFKELINDPLMRQTFENIGRETSQILKRDEN